MALSPGYETDNKAVVEQILVRGIIEKEYAITNANSDKPIIGTFGLGPCIALAGYDPETSTAVIAHIDATTDTQSLAEIFIDMGVDVKDYNRLVIGLIGGDRSSRRKVVEIVQYLESIGVKISFADIMDKRHPSEFVLDSRTGKIIPNITPHDNGPEVDLRMRIASMRFKSSIRKEFDGRK